MVAEMNRLEQAARVSMGGYQDTETQLSSRPSHLPFRLGAVALLAAVVLAAAWQLT